MIKKKIVRVLTVAGLLACLASGCASGGSSVGKEAAADEIKKGGFTVAASCHDPQIIREGDTYYMFGSHMVGAKCQDLRKWNYFANGVDAANTLFDNLLTEPYAAFDFVGKNTDNGYSVWASNVIYNETMKKYVMYFCTTSSYVKSISLFCNCRQYRGTVYLCGYDFIFRIWKKAISAKRICTMYSEKMQIFPDIWNMVDTTIRSGQTVLIRRFLPMQTGGCG